MNHEMIVQILKQMWGTFVGAAAAGILFVWVGLPFAYETRFSALNDTIKTMQQEIALLREQNTRLLEQNELLQVEVKSLTEEVSRLTGFPVNRGD